MLQLGSPAAVVPVIHSEDQLDNIPLTGFLPFHDSLPHPVIGISRALFSNKLHTLKFSFQGLGHPTQGRGPHSRIIYSNQVHVSTHRLLPKIGVQRPDTSGSP